MLHTKFRGNQSTGSWEETFEGFLQYVGSIWRPSWSCDQHHVIKFSFPCTHLHTNLVKKGPVVSEKSKFQFHM